MVRYTWFRGPLLLFLRPFLLLAGLLCVALACGDAARAATLPAGFSERTVVGGLDMPTAVAWTPDGRTLIAEKAGVVKLAEPGQTTARQILDLRSVVHSYWDRGLLGLAVDGQFTQHPYVYLLFTYEMAPANPDRFGPMVSQLRRYRLTAAGDLVEPQAILGTYTADLCPAPSNAVDCIPSEGDSHSIGTVRSAADGTLYVGSGDASSYAIVDPLALRTYDERSLAGKIAHIDRDGLGLPGHAFCPAETDRTKVCAKLYAKGLRNPFRFNLLPGGDGLVVGDVGWGEREEVDVARTAGGNYGWPCYEGAGRTAGYADLAACATEYAKEGTPQAHRAPVWSYDRDGQDAAVVGGPVFTGTSYPAQYAGDVFVGDYAQGWIKHLDLDANDQVTAATAFATNWSGVQLVQTPAGELAYVSFGTGAPGTGSVRAIAYGTGNREPVARAQATPTSGGAPLPVTFSAAGSSDPDGDPLTFRWTFGDGGGSSTAAAPEHEYAAPGTYTATLTVDDGRGGTATDTVRITAGNDPPVPEITAPAQGTTYRGGEIIDLAGAATDPQTGELPAEALSWRVTLHHSQHTHPIVEVAGSETARFRAVQDHDADSWYEVELTATDPGGLTARRTLELRPQTTPLQIESAPAGAPVTYAGRAKTTPYAQDAAVGFRSSVSAAERFVKDGRLWEFADWSDGGERLHDLTIPASALTLTATYRDAGAATGALQATAASTAFGDVVAGASAARAVTLRNIGAQSVTITGSSPPGGQFALDTPLTPGTVVPAGGEVTRTVRFTATELGEVQARWRVTADDGSIVSADLTAAGVIPAVSDPGWQRNGTATFAGGGLELTPAARDRRGTAFWPAPVDARRLDATFDALFTGGTGADGLALILADPARGASATSLGASGAGLGAAGIPGWTAALATWPNNGVDSPFAAISDGATAGAPALLHWVASTRTAELRGAAPHRVRVRVVDGVLKMELDGSEVLSTAVALPDRVLVGFAGATGGRTDRHVVSNASISGAAGPALPPPDGGGGDPGAEAPSLRVTSTVVAPPGSDEEATAIRVAGACPAALTPLSLVSGDSAMADLAGAVAGASCALEQDAIVGDGWSTTAAVNDGAPVALTAQGGVVRVPAFALKGGVNTVVLTNRYQPPAPTPDPGIPDPSAGGWQLNGSASVSPAGLQLTPASSDQKGSAFWPETVSTDGLVVEFDATVENGTGADGMALVLGDPGRGATPASLGGGGGSLGFGGIPGWAVALDAFPNGSQATGNFVGLSDGALAGAWQTLGWLQTTSLLTPLQNTTRHVRVAITAGVITVSLDGAPVLSRAVTLPDQVLLGFSAGTGGLTNRHAVSNVTVNAAAPPPPAAATLRVSSTIVAPSGAPEQGTAVRVTGSCPGAFSTTVASGQSVVPALVGAVQGASCGVAQDVPSSPGWTVSVSVNGGPAQALTPAGGVYPVPAFALTAGENTVALTSTYTPPPVGGIPDPSAGGWQLNGASSISSGALVLTPAAADQKGSAFWPETVATSGLTIDFDATIDGGTGADGMALVLGDPGRGATPASLGGGGGSLGFGGIPGWAVALDAFPNGSQATGNFVGLSDGALAGAWQTLGWLQTTSLLTPLQNTTRHVRVAITAGVITVSLDGAPVISRAVSLPDRVLVGFSAGTGGLTNRHAVSNVTVSGP